MSRTYIDLVVENIKLEGTLEERLEFIQVLQEERKDHSEDIASMNVRIERLVADRNELRKKLKQEESTLNVVASRLEKESKDLSDENRKLSDENEGLRVSNSVLTKEIELQSAAGLRLLRVM